MNRKNNVVEKIIATMAYMCARKNVNSTCISIFYQPVIPEKVKSLKKQE